MPKIMLDDTDIRLLRILQENARLSNVELAERVGLSASPCLRRMRQLEDSGVIKGYMTLIDQTVIGLPVSVFISVTLKEQSERALDEFEGRIRALPEVMECYLMTGTADYLLKEHLTRIPAIASIQSSFALKQVSFRTALPLPLGQAHIESETH